MSQNKRSGRTSVARSLHSTWISCSKPAAREKKARTRPRMKVKRRKNANTNKKCVSFRHPGECRTELLVAWRRQHVTDAPPSFPWSQQTQNAEQMEGTEGRTLGNKKCEKTEKGNFLQIPPRSRAKKSRESKRK